MKPNRAWVPAATFMIFLTWRRGGWEVALIVAACGLGGGLVLLPVDRWLGRQPWMQRRLRSRGRM